jgi:RNA polymerase sigma-70 factor (ECF subfamily)
MYGRRLNLMVNGMVDQLAEARSSEFAQWVAPHLDVMRRLASVMAGGIDPDDIVQEALIHAWKKRTSFDPSRGSARTWLLAITADQARRLRSRWRTWELGDPSTSAAAGGDVTADLDLRQAISALSARQRQAVLLVYYVDLSVAEAARTMNCSKGTVKSTLSDARARLAQLLEDGND